MNEFAWQVRVYYEDTDLGGVVYYANYLKFMERARTEWLRARGVDQARLTDEHGLLFVITACELRYHRPARFNDLLDVTVSPVAFGRSRFTIAQEVQRDGEVLVTGKVTAACVDGTDFMPRPVPAGVLAGMRA